MINVDVDTADTAPNSSDATLTIPTGSTVLWAGLYWGSRAASTVARNQVSFRPAGATGYTTVTATQFDEITSTVAGANFYQGFSDVTSLVRTAGNGTYRVANVKTTVGQVGDSGAYGGWALYVVYQNSTESPRDLTVFDGFARVNSANNVTTTVSGFRTPPSGAFTSRVRTLAYEGDRLVTGDSLQVNGTSIGDTTLNPTNNFYNGSVTNLGTRTTTKNPDYVDQLGIDIDAIELASGSIPNNATSANLAFTSSQDQYFPGVLTFTTDVFEPILSSNFTKTVANTSGTGAPGQGDILNFTISIQNTGNDNGNSVVVTDIIPSSMTYVPGSFQVLSGANAGAKTDAAGDDQATYNSATGQVTFYLGTGATATTGGTLAPNESTTVRLQARINDSVSSGASVSNQATLNFTGAGGTAYSAQSDGDPNTSGAQATTITVVGRDYGDAPDTGTGTGVGNYRTTNADGGPSHSVVAGLSLGAVAADLENGTLQNAAATADDSSGSDDEDGVTSFPPISTSAAQVITIPVTVINTTGAAATLIGYLDFNKDGDFLDLNETSASVSVAPGATTANVVFTTPPGLAAGTTYARFRIGSTATEVTSPTGIASSGEVEDYQVTLGSPDLTISKSHTGNFTRGSTGTYTLTVGNSGNVPTSGTITVSDTLPAGFTVNGGGSGSVTPGGTNAANWSCTSNATSPQVVSCTSITSIPVTGSSTFSLTVNVASSAADSVTNSANVSGGSEATVNNGNNTATDPTTTVAPTDLTLSKSHTGNFTVGQTGTYNFTLNNVGGVASNGTITVTDTLPAGLTLVAGSTSGAGWSCSASGQTVTCTGTNAVAAAGSSSFAFIVNVGLATLPGTNSITNTASVSGGGDALTNNNSASDPTTILSPNLTLAKSHTGNFTRGTTGTYTISVGNTGTAPTAGLITVTDTLPTGLTYVAGSVGGTNGSNWICSASGQTLTCTSTTSLPTSGSSVFTFNVNVAVTTANSITNTATVAGGSEATANNTNNTANDPTTTVGTPDLTVDKSHTDTFIRGSSGTYTFVVGNSGSVATSGLVTLTDTLPANFTVNGGASGPLTAGGANGANWTCSSNAASPQVVTCTSSTGISVGGSSTLTLNVNVGAAAAANVNNTASVAGGGELAANTGNNSDIDPTSTVSAADLTLAKTHTGNFTVGGTGTYSFTVANAGETSSSGTITVSDTLPAGLSYAGSVGGANGVNWSCSVSGQTVTCTSNTIIVAGSNSTFTFNVNIGTNTAPGTNSVTNTATVSGGGDSDTTNNTVSDPTTILSSNLTLSKTHTPTNFIRGSTGTYVITVGNTGDAPTSGTITVTDTLPAGLSIPAGSVSLGGANAAAWSCSAAGQVITCTSTTPIPVLASSSFSFSVSVSDSAGSSVTNTVAVAGGNEAAANNGNNVASDATPIVAPADLTLFKTHTGNFTVGQTGVYSFTVTNGGGSATSGTITVTDTLPTGLTYASSVGGTNGANWSCSASGQTVTCTSSTVIPITTGSNSSTFTISVNVGTSAPVPTLTNTASVVGGGDTTSANSNSDLTTILSSDLTLSKTHSGNFVRGTTGTYNLTVSNGGTAASSGTITVTDTLPTGLSVPSGTVTLSGANAAAWSCLASGQTITCTSAATILVSGSSTFTFGVDVSAGAPASVTNTATVSGGNEAIVLNSNNTANDLTTTVGSPDLTITKTATGTFIRGGTGTYALTVTNSGDAVSNGTITVTDVLPTGLSYSGFSGTGWSCSASGQTVTCTTSNSLAVNGVASVSLNVTVASNAPASVDNTASVSGGGELAANTGNNSSTATTATASAGSLTLSKTVRNVTQGGSFGTTNQGQPGDLLEYCVAYSNPGQAQITSTVLNDIIPLMTSPVISVSNYAGQAIRWRITAPSNTTQNLSAEVADDAGELSSALTVRLGTVPAGGTGDVCFQVIIDE